MSIRFVIGRAGTGKTRHCRDQLVDRCRAQPLGKPVFYLVPAQATFAAERWLTINSGLRGFSRARVVSFETLATDILTECGQAAVPLVSGIGRQLVLGHLLRQHREQLQYFGRSARRPGLATAVHETLAELDRAGVDLAQLANDFTDAVDPDLDPSLHAKLHDLALLHNAYLARLGEDRFDPAKRQDAVLDRVAHCGLIRDAEFFVDEFLEFSGFERRMLVAIASIAEHVTFTLLIDPANPILHGRPDRLPDPASMFFRTAMTYRQLWFAMHQAGQSIEPPLMLSTPLRFDADRPALKHLEAEIADAAGTRSQEADGVRLVVAPSPAAELDAAAREVQRLVRAGMRYRDIVLLMRRVPEDASAIEATLTEHGIPHFLDRRRPAGHHPLVRLVRNVLAIGRRGWMSEAAVEIIKTGMAGIGVDDAERLENYVARHRITGNGWLEPWSYRQPTLSEDTDTSNLVSHTDDAVEPSRLKLTRALAAMTTEPKTYHQHVAALLDVLERLHVRQTLGQWIADAADEPAVRMEHQQVWENFEALLSQMTDLLGDELAELPEFADVLEWGLDQFSLAIIPPTKDQLLVGDVSRTRVGDVRAAIVIGLNEGEFPLVADGGGLLGDAERRHLRTLGREVSPDAKQALLNERLLGYIGLTRASQELVLIRRAADEGGALANPSTFYLQTQALVPNVEEQIVPADPRTDVRTLGTPRQLVSAVVRWAREPDDADNASMRRLYHRVATASESLAELVGSAWSSLVYDPTASLSPELSSQLFASPLQASVSRLELFARNPFLHFARYGLRLKERDDPDLTALDLGNLYHGVLDQVVRRHGELWKQSSDPDAAVSALADELGREIRQQLFISSGRNRYMLRHAKRQCTAAVRRLRDASLAGRFRPVRTELIIGRDEHATLPPMILTTVQGRVVELQGKIDRLDRMLDAARGHFMVIDYKTSPRAFDFRALASGTMMQLLVYAAMVNRAAAPVGPVASLAAVLYAPIRGKFERALPGEAKDPAKLNGLINQAAVDSVDSQFGPNEASQFYPLRRNMDGSLRQSKNTIIEDELFSALLDWVELRVTQLSDDLMAGNISATPARINGQLIMGANEWQELSRHEPRFGYLELDIPSRTDWQDFLPGFNDVLNGELQT